MTTPTTTRLALALSALSMVIAGCSTTEAPPAPASAQASTQAGASAESSTVAKADGQAGALTDEGCVNPGNFDKNTDYFEDKVQFNAAKLIKVDYHNYYKTLEITNPDTKETQKAVLVLCGAEAPALEGDLAGATVLKLPLTKIVTPSTTEISNFELLGTLDHIAATGAMEYTSSTVARDHFKQRNVPAIANQNGDMDAEKIIATKPELVFMAGMASPAYDQVKAAGIPVLDDNAWLEATPLARAEYLKYFALLTNDEAKANTEFERIEKAYNEVKAKVAETPSKPTVLSGSMYQGQWYVPGTDSYVAAYIKDAGGDYIMKSVAGGGSDPVDMEKVIQEGAQADIWINGKTSAPGWGSLADILKDDARLGEFKAVKDGKVWNPLKRIGEGGGNDYWESGVVKPDVVLQDLAAIFHPDQFPNHDFYYYQQTK